MRTAEIQGAIFTRLRGDATLTGMLSAAWGHPAVFTAPPQLDEPERRARFPLVAVGSQMTVTDYSTKDTVGGNVVIQIDAWTREDGWATCRAIADRIDTLLVRHPLAVTGWITTERDTVSFDAEPDTVSRRATMRYRVLYMG